MHQLWQHPNGRWYVLYGPRLKKRVSTGTKDRRQAEGFLSQFIAGSHEPGLATQTVRAILEGYRDDHGKGHGNKRRSVVALNPEALKALPDTPKRINSRASLARHRRGRRCKL